MTPSHTGTLRAPRVVPRIESGVARDIGGKSRDFDIKNGIGQKTEKQTTSRKRGLRDKYKKSNKTVSFTKYIYINK